MIDFIRGTVTAVRPDRVVIDIGPLGLTAICTPAAAFSVRVGERVELITSLVIREDGWTVYGFLDADERTVFEQVQTVSGVGPRLAMGLLATLSPDELRLAVAREDLATLTKVPGVGRKGASRLVLELKDKLGPAQGVVTAGVSGGAPGGGWQASVTAGLTSLGWSAKEAEQAVLAVAPLAQGTDGESAGPDIAVLLKQALRSLDRS
ncbi:MAG: Holliday junction branch migration protein RuvA [Candidatus Nanopelagicales bacterium]|jgi:Holliday junction DNA helicase RuvA